VLGALTLEVVVAEIQTRHRPDGGEAISTKVEVDYRGTYWCFPMASARAVTPEASNLLLPYSSMPQSALLLMFSDVIALMAGMDGVVWTCECQRDTYTL